MTKIDFLKFYEEGYANLNQKQKEAVDTVGGPVMVIAGPGTGKTQILSYRVANILTNYNVKPEAVVCLTFTEAGASEMLDRIEKLMGEEGRKVRVSTIHSFCSELIMSNPDKFGKQPKVISTAVQYEIIKELMDEHILENDSLYKNSGNRYSSLDQLFALFFKMKRENLTKEDIQKEVNEYFKDIEFSVPGDELFKKFKYARKHNGKKAGDLKPSFEKELTKFDKLMSGANIVEKYQEKISKKNYFDFDDMILWTIEKLGQQKEFQHEVSNSIKYLFVDEFQDTSVVQNKLIDLLIKGQNNPNIFIVGDDDQSIYRFQGVSAENILDFEKKYHPTKIVLEENYRSSQAIIDAAKQLISNNQNREEKSLMAAGENKEYQNQKPQIMAYESEEEEMWATLNQIHVLINEGVSPSDIGVIYGRNAYGEKFAKLLRENGIFVQIKEKVDLFSDPFFKKLIAVLKYVNMSTRTVAELRKILYFDFFPVSNDEIISLREVNNTDSISLKNVQEIDKKLEKFRQKVLNSKKYLPPTFIMSEMIEIFDIDKYIMMSKEKYHLVSVLRELYKLMIVEMQFYPQLTLKGFLTCLSGLQEMKITLPIEEISSSPENCVQLMSAHGAKGLEFDYVFMMKCDDGKSGTKYTWPGGENHSGTFSYPPSINGKEKNEKQLKEEENRRLFYVAMTRAKRELHLSYSKENIKTHFLEDFDYVEKTDKNEDKQIKEYHSKFTVPKISSEVLTQILSSFSLSVSLLNSFLNCPLSFYFNKILKFPSEINESLIFGNIIHETLEKKYIPNDVEREYLTPKSILTKEKLLQNFKEIFDCSSWQFSSERVKKDNYARGIKIIENLYGQPEYIKPSIVAVEEKLKG